MQSLSIKMLPGWKNATGNDCMAEGRRGKERNPSLIVFASRSPLSSSPDGEERDGKDKDKAKAKTAASSSSFLSRSHTYALLKQQMAVAAKFEDYKEAARLRDSLRSFEEDEPVLRLRRLMRKAIDEERFEDAANYRDELKVVAPHSLLKCSSDATTLGIRVQVRSVYIEGRSQPLKGQYFFAYRIRITNNSQRPVQLLRRHWIITDANGRTENIWGVGVIGEQPVILPQTGFEYSSACPLSTPNGRMSSFYAGNIDCIHNLHFKGLGNSIQGQRSKYKSENQLFEEGDFEMKHIDRVGSSTFNVAIAPFSLSIIGDDNEAPV